MGSRFVNIGEREILFAIRDVADLIKSRHRIADMGGVRHRLFAGMGKREGRVGQQTFPGGRQPAGRGRARWFPSGFDPRFSFHGAGGEANSG